MNRHKVYFVLMALELTCIGIKYGVSDHNPFQQISPTMLLFILALFSHVLALTADMSMPTNIITFHVSGVVGCEALLWILLAQFLWYYIINLLLLLLASFCFFNYIVHITHLLRRTISNDVQMSNMEPREAQVV
uniref:Uncharacterized protein n=1 Tax=Cajanus cajan TaxID=3821 RepID=A0A151UA98_CAJCA|nr:hypothetical protein KK1_020483 [Cajanus cajan]